MCDVNTFAKPMEDLRCPEHCYSYCLNPAQHPRHYANIYHLIALLTALCNTCGGVIFLIAPGGIGNEKINFRRFEDRLRKMLLPYGFIDGLVETYVECDETFWGIIVAKMSDQMLPYNIEGNALYFQIDVHRQLRTQQSYSQVPVKKHGVPETIENVVAIEDSGIQIPGQPQSNKTVAEESNKGVDSENVGDASSDKLPDGVVLNRLKWDQNKRDWRTIVKDSDQSDDNCVISCDIWKPSSPMTVTPGKEALKYLFRSDGECNETIEHVKTKVPGFAIVHRSWLSFLPEVDVESWPASHLCDILTVTEDNDVCLWVIVSDSRKEVIETQLKYMLTVGRTIKHQVLDQTNRGPNLTVRCKLYSTHLAAYEWPENEPKHLMIQKTQEMLYPKIHEKGKFEGLQKAIAFLILSKGTLSTCVGEQISMRLSQEEARTLLDRKKVTYISSPPGTGKTACGISLCMERTGEDKEQKSVYICPTWPLFQYVGHNGCNGLLINTDDELCDHIMRGTFAHTKCVVIDESHNLQWSRDTWKKLFMLLKKNWDMFLFIFADNEYQCLDSQKSSEVALWIKDLSGELFGISPFPEKPFRKIYRNTRKVVSFLQHSVDDTGRMDVTCANHWDGDGIHCITMSNIWSNGPESSLVKYLRPLLIHSSSSLKAKYKATDVAVLLDIGYTDDKIDAIRQILRDQIPRITTHGCDKFPRDGIVVDRIESFFGLDAGLCIFLLSPDGTQRITHDTHYRVFLASRATQQAIFVVCKIDSAFAESMKFDRFVS